MPCEECVFGNYLIAEPLQSWIVFGDAGVCAFVTGAELSPYLIGGGLLLSSPLTLLVALGRWLISLS